MQKPPWPYPIDVLLVFSNLLALNALAHAIFEYEIISSICAHLEIATLLFTWLPFFIEMANDSEKWKETCWVHCKRQQIIQLSFWKQLYKNFHKIKRAKLFIYEQTYKKTQIQFKTEWRNRKTQSAQQVSVYLFRICCIKDAVYLYMSWYMRGRI